MSNHVWARRRSALGAAFILSIGATLGLAACGGSPDLAEDGDDGAAASGGSTGSGGNGSGGTVNLSGGSSAGGNSGSGSGGDTCAESSESADLVPANLLFVVDKSGSMNCNAPPTDPSCPEPQKVDEMEPSKWEITQDALTGPEGALPVLAGQASISVGLIAFPLDDFCEVPAEGELTVPMQSLSDEHLDAMTAGLTLTADGNTPLAGAAIRGLEALRLGIHAGELDGDNYLVVMTDGAETCQEAALEDLLEYVEVAREAYGIRTYAIGAPGSEASRALLSEMAILGGTRKSAGCKRNPAGASESCHVDLTESSNFEQDLGDEFKGITEATTQTCEYDVPQNALVDPNKVNVEYTPSGGEKEIILQDPPAAGMDQCEGAEGWQFSTDGTQIVLCGQLCDDVLSDPGATVRVVFGCRDTIVR